MTTQGVITAAMCITLGLLLPGTSCGAAQTVLHRGGLSVSVNNTTGELTIIAKQGGAAAVRMHAWHAGPITVGREAVTDPELGPGEQAVIRAADGAALRVSLYDDLPFAVIQDVVVNNTDKPVDITRRVFGEFDVTGPAAADSVRVFGTFGVKRVPAAGGKPIGSYNHLAVVDPVSRRGMVMAWLTTNRGSGVMFADRDETSSGGEVHVTARQDYGRLRVEPHEHEASERLLVGLFDDARIGLEDYADATAKVHHVHLPPEPTVYCTWYHGKASNQKKMTAQADFAEKHLKPFGLSVLQIDDGWQDGIKKNGPARRFLQARPGGPYPSMKGIADYIRSKGMVPGLWFMPYAASSRDAYFADKQGYFYQMNGKPMSTKWGGECLDASVPETQELIRKRTQRICHEWGFGYIKTDGMWTGLGCQQRYVNTSYHEDDMGEAVPADPSYTNVQAYRKGLSIVRETAGPGVFIDACNLAQNMRTLGASIGLVDGMRIGPDNGPRWEAMCHGPRSGSNLYFLHQRVWYNDPDPVYVRPSVPMHEAKALLSWMAISGQMCTSSYQYADLPADRLDLLKRAMPSHTLQPRPVDLFEQSIPRVWLLTDDHHTPRRDVLGLFNWDEKGPATVTLDVAHVSLPPAQKYVAFDYWANKFLTLTPGESLSIDPASCRVIAVRPVAGHPQLLSTSRHITQGIVDVNGERWDAAARTLSGTSDVIAGDPYELRIARPVGTTAAIDHAEVAGGGAKITVVGEEPLGWRVRIDSPTGGAVAWRIVFK